MNNEILDEDFRPEQNSKISDKRIRAKINNIKVYVNTNIQDVKTAKILLIVISVFLVFGTLLNLFFNLQIIEFYFPLESIIKGVIYFVIALMVKRNPKKAMIAGLCFFFAVQLYNILDGSVVLQSWGLFKIPLIYILIKGVQAALNLEKDAKKLLDLGVPEQEIALMKALKEVPNS